MSDLSLRDRYVVEVNIDGLTGQVIGDWEPFTVHDELIDAVRACSDLLTLAKTEFGVGYLESWMDELIEPWIRVHDRLQERAVVWSEGDGLRCLGAC